MTSIQAAVKGVPKRQYIATAVFNTNIFTYSTYVDANLQTRGSLTLSAGATAQNSTAGHILRENGKRLHEGVNPDLLDPTSGLKYTYLIGVYDAMTFVNGFIDPNCPLFAPFNTDKSYSNNPANEVADGYSGLIDEGPPVYTRGTITTTDGNIVASVGSVSAGTSVSATTTVSAGTSVTATTYVKANTYLAGGVVALTVYQTGLAGVVYASGVSCDIFIDPRLGNVFTVSLPNSAPFTSLTTNINAYCSSVTGVAITPPAGTTVVLIVTNQNGQTPAIVAATNVKATNLTCANTRTTTMTFVSNGTSLVQTGSSANIPI